ncbi:dephospho-CoA kinase [Candidatus Woesearchaeota archaeon CG11_big_fil_rev_8_21_14_0_20_43_8]|nr:MAG: dephospho-CoA kinase [Candidatus Woesearchaeota archaeon CG11_big_fil_rev_8_21_14_0_20_43_8]
MILGITGNIGSGKSTVAFMFAKLGAQVIDADKIGHGLQKKGTGVYDRLVETFGEQILGQDGEISRSILGGMVFSDPTARLTLNSIMHPMIREEIQKIISQKEENKMVIIDAALLVEAGFLSDIHKLIVVIAKKDIRFMRLIDKGIPRERIISVMQTQSPQIELIKDADYIIDNSKTLGDTEIQVRTIWEELQ